MIEKLINSIAKIYLHYRPEPQRNKAIEELSELITAISRNDAVNVKEEIADVLIIIEQLKFYYDISQLEIDRVINYKIERTLIRINDKSKFIRS